MNFKNEVLFFNNLTFAKFPKCIFPQSTFQLKWPEFQAEIWRKCIHLCYYFIPQKQIWKLGDQVNEFTDSTKLKPVYKVPRDLEKYIILLFLHFRDFEKKKSMLIIKISSKYTKKRTQRHGNNTVLSMTSNLLDLSLTTLKLDCHNLIKQAFP